MSGKVLVYEINGPFSRFRQSIKDMENTQKHKGANILITFRIEPTSFGGWLHNFVKSLVESMNDRNMPRAYQVSLDVKSGDIYETIFVPRYGQYLAGWIKESLKIRPEIKKFLVKSPAEHRETALSKWREYEQILAKP